MRELCFITIARIFNVGAFIIYEFCKLRGIPYRKDRWGRGFVMRPDFDLNDFAAYVASQDRSYRGEVNKMDHLFRDKDLQMRRKKCESDIRRMYLYSPGWNIIRVSLMVGVLVYFLGITRGGITSFRSVSTPISMIVTRPSWTRTPSKLRFINFWGTIWQSGGYKSWNKNETPFRPLQIKGLKRPVHEFVPTSNRNCSNRWNKSVTR